MQKKQIKRSALALLLWGFFLLTSACSSLHRTPPPPPAPVRIGLMLSPASLGKTLSLQQHLKVEREGRIQQLDAVLVINPQRLELVGLAFGQRVLTLQYNGKSLQTWRHPYMPAQVNGENVLEDIQLTLWPATAIRQALPIGWRVEESERRRTLLFNNVPVVLIDYSSKRRWSDKVILTNLRYGYRLTIQSAPA